MPSLRIIAHGSRRAASNDEVRQLADLVRAQAGSAYTDVETAFLELAEPGSAMAWLHWPAEQAAGSAALGAVKFDVEQ